MDPLQAWLDAEEVRRLAEGLMAPAPQLDESADAAAYGQGFEGFAGDQPIAGEQWIDPGQPGFPVKPQHAMPTASQTNAKLPIPAEYDMGHESAPELPPVQQTAKPFFRPAIDVRSRASAPAANQGHDIQAQAHHGAEASQVSVETSFREETSGQIQGGGLHMPFLSRLEHFSELIRHNMGARAMFLIDDEGQILLDEVKNDKLIQVARTLTNRSFQAGRQIDRAVPAANLHVKITASTTLEIMTVHSRYGLLILGVIFPAPIGVARVIELSDQLYQAIDPGQ